MFAYPKFNLWAHEQEELLSKWLQPVEVVRMLKPLQPVPRCCDLHDASSLHQVIMA